MSHYEPGDSLVDKAVAIYESDRLLYQEWSTCVSREHELATGLKKDTGLTFDASGALKLASKQHAAPCDTSSEMMVRYCLVRRGLALEQANVLSYENHDLLVEKLFQYRLQEPLPDFARVSMQQMQAADRKFFVLLAEVTRSGIKASAAGRPCDKAFQSCLTSSEFLTILQHKPLAVYSHDVCEPPLKRPRVEGARGGKGAKGPGKGQTPGKGDGKGESAGRVPAELLALGCVGATPKGHRLCFDFSLKKCCAAVQNQRCSKGLHLCAVKGCHKVHAALDCSLAKVQGKHE